MAEDKKVTISRTLNGNTIYYIARNGSGTIFARELTLEKLEAAIKIYKEPPPEKEEEEEEEGKGESVKGEEEPKEKGKKFLANKLSEKVQKRKKEQETEHLPGEVAPAAHLEGETPEEPAEEAKKLLENDLQAKVEERKEQSKKKSFWDKLK